MLSIERVTIGSVTFEPGCRNNWHIHHKGGQILLCSAREGYYQEWGQPARRLHPGDVVNTPPEVKHWHGAVSDSWFARSKAYSNVSLAITAEKQKYRLRGRMTPLNLQWRCRFEIAQAAIRKLGWEPVLKPSGGGSDANYYNPYGIPCAVLGTGTRKIHTTERYIKVDDLCKTAGLAIELVRHTAGYR